LVRRKLNITATGSSRPFAHAGGISHLLVRLNEFAPPRQLNRSVAYNLREINYTNCSSLGPLPVDSDVGWLLISDVYMNYKVVVHESEEGFSVSCPGLPGCWSQGETEAEALENIQVAIREYLAAIDDLVKGQDVREVRVAV
jgi:predicted RNase H-like HicB family nuclease